MIAAIYARRSTEQEFGSNRSLGQSLISFADAQKG